MVNESNKKVEVKIPGKFKKEKVQAPPSKIVIRKLPPTFTEEDFKNAISPVPENNYFSFVPPDKVLGTHAFSRAYINFLNTEEIVSFRDRFDGYVFVDQKGNEYPALVEYAPFQKIPKSNHNKKDIRCGTIDEDPDYVAFLEALQNPEAVNLPQIETLLEEIENAEREIRANNGILKVKTPLLEYIEQRNSERFRPGDRKRRKEFDRKKTREEEKRRKKEYIKEYRKRDDYYAAKEERERERAKRREEEKLKWKEKREEREKLRREKVAERFKNDEKSDSKNFPDDSTEMSKSSSQTVGKENSQREEKSKFPTQKSKRYSEVRKKEEKERKKDNMKNKVNEEKKEEAPVIKEEEEEEEGKVKTDQEIVLPSVIEKEAEIININETKLNTKDEDFVEETEFQNKDYEQDEIEEAKCDKEENFGEEENEECDKDDKMNKDKDPRNREKNSK
ncbi:Regulator of nonsense transcripts 3A [Armadillidium nasatum]|uniref:Regulator of nonsense transcripts 3A n=1 Tax=Armadillidium nasatum TaxID=96803 RepID=A0A5N5SK75_9CRUS|nr:Regulator of nonsense transcripts 3A [Armadillidium nasatum]